MGASRHNVSASESYLLAGSFADELGPGSVEVQWQGSPSSERFRKDNILSTGRVCRLLQAEALAVIFQRDAHKKNILEDKIKLFQIKNTSGSRKTFPANIDAEGTRVRRKEGRKV